MTTREKQRAATFNRVLQLNNLISSGIVVKTFAFDSWEPVASFSYKEGDDFFHASLQVDGSDASFSYGVGHHHSFKIEVGSCVFEDCKACEE